MAKNRCVITLQKGQKMSDEVMAENEKVEETTPEETPTPEEQTTVESDVVEADVAEPTEEDAEPEKVAKKSAQGRIQQLNSKLKEEQRKRSALEEKVNSIVQENEENPFSPVNMPLDPNSGRLAQPNANGEITYEDYQRDVQQNAKASVKAILDQQKLKQEALDVVREYPELDPNNLDTFDEELSDAITEAVEGKHRLSRDFSLKSTVDKLMKPYRRAAEKAVDTQSRSIAKDVASGGIRPSSNPTPVSKEPADESIEEMEARLGRVY